MESFHEYMNEYKKQLNKGYIQEAYQGLMDYFGDLRSYLKNKHPEYFVSSSIYYGYDIFFLLSKIIKTSKFENCDRFYS
jgi:hypothetical protein